MHALYTCATFLTVLNETNLSIKENSPSAMNTLKGIRKQKTEKKIAPSQKLENNRKRAMEYCATLIN